MNVTMIDYTGAGSKDPARHAALVLIFTKSTRLQMSPALMNSINLWPDDKVQAELEYMSKTIPSSWEFCDYTFLITGVTRAFTHQLVRSRNASYAQQTMRILNVDGWDYGTGPTISASIARTETYARGMDAIAETYRELIADGAAVEDARGILPTNILTNIVMKANLRNLCDLLRKRASVRTQGEYRDVMDLVRAEIVRVHPFAEIFLNRSADTAIAEMEKNIVSMDISIDDRTKLIKLLDQVRMFA